MDPAIALLDGLATGLFAAAAMVAWLTHRRAARRTHIWAPTALAFALFCLDRASNMLEWGMTRQFAWMDALQGYVSALACLVLLGLALRFLHLVKEAAPSRQV